MIHTEDLMVILYEEAQINGKAEKQIENLSKLNNISIDEVLNILERNGCDVGEYKKKRGRPKKLTAEIKNRDSKKENTDIMIEHTTQQDSPKIKEEPSVISYSEPKTPATLQEALNIPKVVFEISKQKLESNNHIIAFHEERLAKLKGENDELVKFLELENLGD